MVWQKDRRTAVLMAAWKAQLKVALKVEKMVVEREVQLGGHLVVPTDQRKAVKMAVNWAMQLVLK